MTEALAPGYYIERIFAQQLTFEGVPDVEGLPDSFHVDYAWEWTPVDEQSFFVVLAARGSAGKDRPELVAVSIAGKFRREGKPDKPPFVDFVMVNATTILVPYVREAFSSLSARGLKGPYTLGPLNVIHMMSTIKFELSKGADRLANRPDLVVAYSISADVMAGVRRSADITNGALPSGTQEIPDPGSLSNGQ